MLISCRIIAQISFLHISEILIVLVVENYPREFKSDKKVSKIFQKQALMRIGKVSDFSNILGNNNNFQVTLNTRVLTLLPIQVTWWVLVTTAIDLALRLWDVM